MEYLRCPECGKRRVTLRIGIEDWYVCDRCEWSVPRDPDTDGDRARLAQLGQLELSSRAKR